MRTHRQTNNGLVRSSHPSKPNSSTSDINRYPNTRIDNQPRFKTKSAKLPSRNSQPWPKLVETRTTESRSRWRDVMPRETMRFHSWIQLLHSWIFETSDVRAAGRSAKQIAVGKIVPPRTPRVNWHLIPGIRHEFSKRNSPACVQAGGRVLISELRQLPWPRPLLSRSSRVYRVRDKLKNISAQRYRYSVERQRGSERRQSMNARETWSTPASEISVANIRDGTLARGFVRNRENFQL